MKLLYLYLGDVLSQTNGVNFKINSQVEKLNLFTEYCHLVSFSEKVDKLTPVNSTTLIYPIKKTEKGKYFHTYKGRKDAFESIIEFLDKQNGNYDKIFMRFPYYADSHSYKLFKKYKIAVEHNAIEESDMRQNIKKIYSGIPFSLKPGFFLAVTDRVLLPYIVEKLYAKRILKKITVGICVSKEIAEFEEKRCPGYHTRVITNGIDTSKINLRSKHKKDNVIRGFLLAGYNAPWNGIERIISGMKAYTPQHDFEIHLIGVINSEYKEIIEKENLKNIFIHPTKTREEISEFTKDFDFSFGSLAWYLNNLNEATPLKVRSSLANGFPVVNAYYDTDIESSEELKKYCLTFPNNSTPLDFKKIKEFIDGINLDKEHPVKIRNIAYPLIDMEFKMKSLVSTLQQYN